MFTTPQQPFETTQQTTQLLETTQQNDTAVPDDAADETEIAQTTLPRFLISYSSEECMVARGEG